jgi:ferric-dicitrate binding protein FerR (iron transport regulator)
MSEPLHPAESGRGARDPIGALLRSAGPGEVPDAARMERAMQVVHREWQSVLAGRRRARWRWMAAAACLCVVTLAALSAVLWPRTAAPVATVARVEGEVLVHVAERGGGPADSLAPGRVLRVGEEIATSTDGRALLAITSGAQLRLDSRSVVQWVSPVELRLLRGTVYAETSGGSSQLVISTPYGIARHVGTRFEVRVADGRTRVRVREGAVDFQRKEGRAIRIEPGQQLVADESRAEVQAGPGSADAQWAWTREIGPAFEIEGQSLFVALDWLGRETGLRVVYRDEQARSQAQAVILRGSIEGLDTRDALLAVLAGSDLVFSLDADRIEIGVGNAETGASK